VLLAAGAYAIMPQSSHQRREANQDYKKIKQNKKV